MDTMEGLPNEVLRMIIKFLDKKNLLSARLVNKKWQICADENLRTMEFTLKYDIDISTLIKITSGTENSNPLFIRFNISGGISDEILETLSSNYGKKIQALTIQERHKEKKAMLELLMNTPNIEKLCFINSRCSCCGYVELKNEYKFDFPKLRKLQFGRTDIHLINSILKASPNLQQVNFKSLNRVNNHWEDFVTILQLIAVRHIKLQLEIRITDSDVYVHNALSSEKLNEMTRIPLTVNEIRLYFFVNPYDRKVEMMARVHESIEQFINKHSTNLRHLYVHYSTDGEEVEQLLKLELKDLDNLKTLELNCRDDSFQKKERNFLEVNLGQAPLLQSINTRLAELYFEQPVPSLKCLFVDSSCINTLLRLSDETFQLEKLFVNYQNNEPTTTEDDECVQLLNNFLIPRAKGLRELKIVGINSTILDKVQLSKMENLQKLELGNMSQHYVPATGSVKIYLGTNMSNNDFKDMLQIPTSVSQLKLQLSLPKDEDMKSDLTSIQESIEYFIHKHSKTLKHLKIKFNTRVEEEQLMLNLKGMKNLEKLKLASTLHYKPKRCLEVNLEHAPLLKEVKVSFADLNLMSPVPLIKSFSIDSDHDSKCFKRSPLADETIQLEEIHLNFPATEISTKGGKNSEANTRVQIVNHILHTHANNLRNLSICAMNSNRLGNIQFPKMKKLDRLELDLSKVEKNEKFKLNQSYFPSLKILSLNTPLHQNPSLIQSLENVHTLILKQGSVSDFQHAGLMFPKLLKLHIFGTIPQTDRCLKFVFASMTTVKELEIESGGTWKQLVGNYKDVDLLDNPFNTLSLNTSVPNLGNMTVLETLKLGERSICHCSSVKAVAYLISCGKLTNLKYCEASLSIDESTEIIDMQLIPRLINIIEANNTKIKINFREEY